MFKKPPSNFSKTKSNLFFRFLHLSGKNGWNFTIIGIFGLFILSLLFFWIKTLSTPGDIKFQFLPSDIVYGEKIHAVHDIGTGNFSSAQKVFPLDSTLKPEIRLSEKFYDFGEVDSQQVLTRIFVIGNFGQSPLIITRAYTTCRCTTADFTSNEIPPGKVALMTLQFNPGVHDMSGMTVWRGVMIETNDPDHPLQEILIQAKVR